MPKLNFNFQLSIFLCFLFFITSFFSPVYGQSKNEFLPTGKVIDSDYFRMGQTVQINGDIHGDTFLVGGVVTVNGKIDGDLFVVGGKIIVNGEVGNSVRIVGGDVTLNGPVGRNALLICGNCSVSKVATVSGSLMVAGGNLEVNTPTIGRGFRFFGSRLYLNSIVSNEAYVVADQEFILGPQSSISGNLKYTGSQTVVREPGATVGGTISFEKSAKNEQFPKFFGAKAILASYERVRPITDFAGFAISAIVGFILLGLFPKPFEKAIGSIENQLYASFGWGIISVVMILVIAGLLAITIVGIPVSLLLILLGYVAFIAAQYVVSFFVGRRVLFQKFGERRGWAMILGLFLLYLLGLIPIIGNLIKIVLTLIGLGAILLAYRQPTILNSQYMVKRNWANKQSTRAKK